MSEYDVALKVPFFSLAYWRNKISYKTYGGFTSSHCTNTGFREPGSTSWSLDITIKYTNGMNCQWFIFNPYPTGYMRISFNNFNVNALYIRATPEFEFEVQSFCLQTESCCDGLNIYDGGGSGSPQILTWGGDRGDVSYTWTKSIITIRFYSDGSVTRPWIGGTISYHP